MQYFLFNSALVFFVEGRDATRYLQARLTNDIKRLHINSCIPAAALTAQGKVEGLFRVYKQSDTQYYLISDGGNPELQLKALSRFIVADRVTISDVTNDWGIIYVSESYKLDMSQDEFAYPSKRASLKGIDILIKKSIITDRLIALCKQGSEMSSDSFHVNRVNLKIPQFGEEFQDSMLFSECLIEDAISFQKGCYVGQEVIEKIDSRGEAPRILLASTSESHNISKGCKVLDNSDEKIGEVLTWYTSSGRNAGFIRIRNEPPFDGLKTDSGAKLTLIDSKED